jgi:membrane-bound ClpP family serine protease
VGCGYYFHAAPVSHFILLATLFFLILVLVIAFKTKTWQKLGLKTSINGHVETAGSDTFKVGDTGRSISRLAPIGKVMINEKIVEARSMGGFIDPNVAIVVIRTEKNKLFIEPKLN